MTRDQASAPLRIWALLGARAGDNDQVLALAEAIGLPFEIKQLRYNGLRRLGPRLLGRTLRSLTGESRRAILAEAPPDVTLSVGHRSVPVVRWLRKRSAGRTRSIHIGFPRLSPDQFDLVIATPQYPIADSKDLLRIPWALTRAATSISLKAAGIQDLVHPHSLLLVGGPTLYWEVDQAAVMAALKNMLHVAERQTGSVIVSTSPRTPSSVTRAIRENLELSSVPSLLTGPGRSPDYRTLLDAADTIHVTADSVAMVSDAIWTGKPIALIPARASIFGKAIMGATDRIRPDRRLYPRDLRFFWRGLAELGVSSKLTKPHLSTDDLLKTIVDRVRRVLQL